MIEGLVLLAIVTFLAFRVRIEDWRYQQAVERKIYAICHPQSKGVRKD